MRTLSHWKVAVYSSCYISNVRQPDCYDEQELVYTQLAHILSRAMGFSFEILYENSASILLPNGNWTGVVGLVNRSEVDVGIAATLVTEQRTEAVTFSHPYQIQELIFVTRKPDYAADTSAIFQPLSSTVWIAACLSLILMTVFTYVAFGRRVRYLKVATNILAVCLRSASTIKPSKVGEQLVLASWFIGAFILMACYTSVMLSFLTLPVLSGIRNIPELTAAVQSKQWRCMVVKGGALQNILSESSSSYARIIGDSIRKDPRSQGSDEIFLQNAHQNIALITGREYIDFLKDRYFLSSDFFFQLHLAFPVRKGFPYREKLDASIQRMFAAQIFSRMNKQVQLQKTRKMIPPEVPSSNFHVLGLRNLGSAFVLLLSGYGAAIVALIIELILNATKTKGCF